MIKLIVFDMAGTTIDENNVVYKTLQATLQAAGYTFSLEEVLAVGAGKEKRDAIDSLMKLADGISDEKRLDLAFSDFLERLNIAYENLEVKPCLNAASVIAFFRDQGIKVALNTGYNRDTAQKLLHCIGWEQGSYFDLLITADEVANARPAPDMIKLAQKKLGIEDASQVIKVGDSQIDIEEGKNAGCKLAIGITTGAHTAAQLYASQPDHVIENLEELIPILGFKKAAYS
jgi:phosphonatase-like hydrolase